MTLPEGFVLVSLDVVSLFTNIPYGLLLEILKDKWLVIRQHTTLKQNNLFGLLWMVCENCFFSFNGNFYQYIFGTPMGSPISPILAQIVMDWALDRILEGLPFVPPFIYKFVDNIITSIV